MNASVLFSGDYFEARRKFLAAASAAGARVASWRHPFAKGPGREDLFIDVATLGADNASKGLLVISGTHGAEGYAGSAIQTGWLSQAQLDATNMRIVLVHALNPYGFAWNRRVTEDNVDLNRNFVDRTKPLPANADYDLLADAIAPLSLDDESLDAASRALRNYAKDNGAFAMQETISKGQYTRRDGLYFGGTTEQWSAGTLRAILKANVAGCRHVAVIDIHSGLGNYGDAELISEDPVDAPAYLRARSWWGDSVASTRSGDSLSAQVFGSLDSAMPGMLAPADTTMICLEYGTFSTLEVFQALRADNWLLAVGNPEGPDAQAIKSQIRRAFYPDQDDWKDKVWTRGREVIAQAIAGLNAI
jgi:predicted deacylase